MDDRLISRASAARGALLMAHGAEMPDAETILSGIADGIVGLDNEWRLVYANAAATPRPSAMPPAATTGNGFTASTICGIKGKLPMVPVCPPAS